MANVQKQLYRVLVEGHYEDHGVKKKGDTIEYFPRQAKYYCEPYGDKLEPIKQIAAPAEAQS